MLEDSLIKTSSLLQFDGIDEVISSAPWIIDGIEAASRRYPKSQILCSSRIGGEYLEDITYLGFKLLPFTDQQRKKFITNWFKNPKEERIKIIIDHLTANPDLGEIVRNPLLATILCVLAEHGIQLPKSEMRLYQERVRLLLGHYDLHKQSKRITSTQHTLNLVARKLAFYLHETEQREIEYDDIIEISIRKMPGDLDKKAVVTAVNELIHPCNILEPKSYQKNYGFGHFRYQEFFAATEMNQNRGINVSQYLYKDWWRGALVLFTQLSDNIGFLVKDAIRKKCTIEAKPTFDAILKERPPDEQEKYSLLIKKAIQEEEHQRRYSSQR